MRIDWYSKLVLTVIAAALVANVAHDYVLPARAAEVQRVAICNTGGATCAPISSSAGLAVAITNTRDFIR